VDEQDTKSGFKVEDRRRFSATGEAREPDAADASQPGPESPPAPPSAEGVPAPEMTFSTFVLSLSTQALILLGEKADPSAPADLVSAKQLIDILGILQAKTKGNLDASETNLLSTFLYDLRMKYVERAQKQ